MNYACLALAAVAATVFDACYGFLVDGTLAAGFVEWTVVGTIIGLVYKPAA